jgi:hypothetical protein
VSPIVGFMLLVAAAIAGGVASLPLLVAGLAATWFAFACGARLAGARGGRVLAWGTAAYLAVGAAFVAASFIAGEEFRPAYGRLLWLVVWPGVPAFAVPCWVDPGEFCPSV